MFYLTFESKKDIGRNVVEVNINFIKYILFLYPKSNQKRHLKKKKKSKSDIEFFDGYLIPFRFALWLFILGKLYLFITS